MTLKDDDGDDCYETSDVIVVTSSTRPIPMHAAAVVSTWSVLVMTALMLLTQGRHISNVAKRADRCKKEKHEHEQQYHR